MSSVNVGGAGGVTWPDREWGVASRKARVERVDSIKKVVDDPRTLGPVANATARRTNPATPLTQQDFEIATRSGPNGLTMKSFDQLVPNAPKVGRNPWNPAADRTSVNGYDHILDSLRDAALKRDAALAGSAKAEAAPTAFAERPDTVKPASKPLTASEFGEAYVRNAIAQYQRTSSLAPEPERTPPPDPDGGGLLEDLLGFR
jgi:hypothetical protein